MKIMIDGCDGTGKTTIVNELSKIYRCNIVKLTRFGPERPTVYLDFFPIEDTIHDRTFVSALIYPKVFNEPKWLSDKAADAIANVAKLENVHGIILSAPDDVIEKRIMDRGKEYAEVLDNIHFINMEYIKYARRYGYHVVNTTKPLHEVIQCIRGIVDEKI